MAFAQITYRESLRDIGVSTIGQALSYGFARADSPLPDWPTPTKLAIGGSTPSLAND
jgi:hypothetical protein